MPHKIVRNQIYHVRFDFHVLKIESTTVEGVGNARNYAFQAYYSEFMSLMEESHLMLLKIEHELAVLYGKSTFYSVSSE